MPLDPLYELEIIFFKQLLVDWLCKIDQIYRNQTFDASSTVQGTLQKCLIVVYQ